MMDKSFFQDNVHPYGVSFSGLWMQTYVAAITGVSARPGYTGEEIIHEAVGMANIATEQMFDGLDKD